MVLFPIFDMNKMNLRLVLTNFCKISQLSVTESHFSADSKAHSLILVIIIPLVVYWLPLGTSLVDQW